MTDNALAGRSSGGDVTPNEQLEFSRGRSHFESIDDAVEYAMQFNPRRDPRLLRISMRHHLRRLADGRWTLKRDRRHLSPERFRQIVAQAGQFASEAHAISCPTLVVRGAESHFSDADAAEFADLVPDGRWVVVEHAGHNVQGDNPRGLLDAMRPFLAEVAVT